MAFFPPSKRRTPSMEAFFAPINLTDLALVNALTALAQEVASLDLPFLFQRRNSRSIMRKIKVLLMLLEALRDSISPIPPSATLCCKELYIIIYRTKMLFDYCSNSSRLWMLIQNPQISNHFHDLNQEISTLLDVLPIKDLELTSDVKEQMELLHKQTRRSKLFVDPADENLRREVLSALDGFEQEQIPDQSKLQMVFDRLRIKDGRTCNAEIEFLEEQMCTPELDEHTVPILINLISLVRYCKFLLFGTEEESNIAETRQGTLTTMVQSSSPPFQDAEEHEASPGEEILYTIPDDFRCPISLDLMRDPVIASTGQTYDRISISKWIEQGHNTCPKSGQMLSHTDLIPNRALRSLIAHWCTGNGIPYDQPENTAGAGGTAVLESAAPTKAAIQATKATAQLLVEKLSRGSSQAKTLVARELRLLAKSGKENRACIAEAGAIPLLFPLLSSTNPIAQENSVTAILNLSIHEANKTRIMAEEGCLRSIVKVLRFGLTVEAMENAAATLFSLSAVHEYKKRIADEPDAINGLLELLREGSMRGKKDAVTALFNLSTHKENCERMVESGAVGLLVAALRDEWLAEEAAAAVAVLVRQAAGVAAVSGEEGAVVGLMGLLRWGTPRGKENAVVALLEICRSGGAEVVEKVVREPSLVHCLQVVMFSGTTRARRKAASLARVCQRCEIPLSFAAVGYGPSSDTSRHEGAGTAAMQFNPAADLGGAGNVSLSMSVSVSLL